MKTKKRDYRVVEYITGFKVQRFKTVTSTTGILWWKKTKTDQFWIDLDKFGKENVKYIFNGRRLNKHFTKFKVYKTHKKAEKAIDLFVRINNQK